MTQAAPTVQVVVYLTTTCSDRGEESGRVSCTFDPSTETIEDYEARTVAAVRSAVAAIKGAIK